MIDKLTVLISGNSGTAMPTGDKQHPVSVKKVPLRELPNETRNIITKSPTSSPLPKDRTHPTDTNETRNTIAKPPGSSPPSKDRGLTLDTPRLPATKRPHPDSTSNPSSLQPSGNSGANGHLVYVRRRLETEPGKISTCANIDGADPPDLRKCGNEGMKDPKAQQDPAQVPKTSPSPVFSHTPMASWTTSSEGPSLHDFVRKPFMGLAAGPEPKSMVTDGIPIQVDPQRPSNQDWKERFIRLQIYLQDCDQASPEDYIRKLHSLSAAGRNKHAVELERRAIQLLLEEGKEFHRMKVLNVLGKALPKDNTSLSTETPSPPRAMDAAKFFFSRNG